MERRQLVLILGLVVIASGCAPGDDNQGKDPNTVSEDGKAVEVQEVSVSPQEIYDGSSVRAGVQFRNAGLLPASIRLGDEGSRVLKNYCPDIFEIEKFQTVGPGGEDMNRYRLDSGRELQIQWELQERDSNRVPLIGNRCNLKFEVPFNYSVNAYRQIQVKQSREVEGSKLSSESSSGPLRLVIEVIGGTGTEGKSTYISGEDDTMRVLIRLQNLNHEEVNKGVVDIDEESLVVEADGPDTLGFREEFQVQETCTGTWCVLLAQKQGSGEDQTTMQWTRTEGPGGHKCEMDKKTPIKMFEGQSRDIVCDIEIPDSISQPSELVEISASLSYTYRKDIGTRTVEVKHRGS